MSRNSAAKKARRRKRLATRAPRVESSELSGELADIAAAVTEINDWLVDRGWLLDEDSSNDDLLNWVYPPSAADASADEAEPVTRVWIALEEDDEQVTLEMGAVLVGAAGEDGMYLLDSGLLARQVELLEAYRVGQPPPVLEQ